LWLPTGGGILNLQGHTEVVAIGGGILNPQGNPLISK